MLRHLIYILYIITSDLLSIQLTYVCLSPRKESTITSICQCNYQLTKISDRKWTIYVMDLRYPYIYRRPFDFEKEKLNISHTKIGIRFREIEEIS